MPEIKSKWSPANDKFRADKALAPQLSARDLEALFGDFLNNCYGQGGIRIVKNRGRPWVWMLDPLDGLNYGFKVSVNTDTELYINRGYCQYAANAYEAKGNSTLAVAATGSVYITLNIVTGAWSDCTYAATASVPASSATSTTYIIADVTVTSGAIASVLQRHVGDIIESRV